MSSEAPNPEMFRSEIKGLVKTVATQMVVAAALAALKKALATNIQKSNITGNETLAPTEKQTTLSNDEASASKKEGALASDSVSTASGSVDAAEVEAKASTAESTAAEAGATATRAKAGSCDIETKAMKIV